MNDTTNAPGESADPSPVAVPWWRRGSRLALVGGVVAVAVAVVGLGYWMLSPSSFELDGTLTLTATDLGITSDSATLAGCSGYSGFSDIKTGANVTIYDDVGKVVGSGGLEPGTYTGGNLSCQFRFAISAVPTGSKVYAVEVTHRGRVTMTADAAKSGREQLTLGQPTSN